MRYLRVRWIHSHPDEPIDLYSEIDADGFEQRKIEIFSDGRLGFADAAENSSETNTFLSERMMPSNEEIAQDAQFQPTTITQEEFERIWARRGLQRLSV